jgi:hypothetical protein
MTRPKEKGELFLLSGILPPVRSLNTVRRPLQAGSKQPAAFGVEQSRARGFDDLAGETQQGKTAEVTARLQHALDEAIELRTPRRLLRSAALVLVVTVLVTIPNGVVVSNVTTNFSRLADSEGVYVPTSITIGYDTPWRQVHALLLLAAERTPGVRANPKPVVRQTALEDFDVKYTLMIALENRPHAARRSARSTPASWTRSTNSASRSRRRTTRPIRRTARSCRPSSGTRRRPNSPKRRRRSGYSRLLDW